MRSTRASAAVARLNRRVKGQRYELVVTGAGLFRLREEREDDGVASDLGSALALDAFVAFVDALHREPLRPPSKNDAAFARQLVKKR